MVTLAYRDILRKQTQNTNQHSKKQSVLPTASQYPLLLSIFWVCLIYAYCLLLLRGECMQKKGEKNVGKIKLCSFGPYPNAYVSLLRNQSSCSSTSNVFVGLYFLMNSINFAFYRNSTFGDLRVST